MAYTSWSVVAGEQPTAAKWNILGENDAAFNDGSGIQDEAIKSRHYEPGSVGQSALDNNVIGSDQLINNIPVKAIAAGKVGMTLGAGNTTVNVSFPSGRFSSSPYVVGTFERDATNGHAIMKVQNVSTSGCDFLCRNESDDGSWGGAAIEWIAIEMA